jgi:hypothetical protein
MHADFATTIATLNGFLLWRIVSCIASGSQLTIETALMKESRFMDNFTSCSHRDNEPIADYFFRFKNSMKDITLAGLPRPAETIQALRFIENLSDRHSTIFIESGAQRSVFCTPGLLSNLRTLAKFTWIEGVNSEGAPIRCTQSGEFLNFGPVFAQASSSPLLVMWPV